MADNPFVDVVDDLFRKPLAKIDHHRWIKWGQILESLQTDEELEIGIFLDLLHQFIVGEAEASFDDQQCAKCHSKWLSGCSKALAELRCVVIFQVFPGDEFGQLDPAVITRELAAKWQEEIFKRELMTRLASVHEENSVQLFG
jgi:hypothetical protein